MKILKLTLKGGKNIFVNFNLVTDFHATENELTMICFGRADYQFQVIEPVDFIFNLLK